MNGLAGWIEWENVSQRVARNDDLKGTINHKSTLMNVGLACKDYN